MTHTSNLIMWALWPFDDNILLFEAAIPSDKRDGVQWVTFENGVRQSYELLQVYIHLN